MFNIEKKRKLMLILKFMTSLTSNNTHIVQYLKN